MKFRKFAILVFSGAMFISLSSFCEQLKVWNDTNSSISVMVFYVDNNLKNSKVGPMFDVVAGKEASTKIDVTKGTRVDIELAASRGAALKQVRRDFPIENGSDIEVVWDGNDLATRVIRSRAGAGAPPVKRP